MVFPVLVGGGTRLFPDSPRKRALKLVDVKKFDPGVIVCAYRPA